MAPYLTLLAYYLAAALSFSFSHRYPFLYFIYLLTNFIIQATILVIISWTISTLRHGTNQVLDVVDSKVTRQMKAFNDFHKQLYAKDDLSAVLIALMTTVEAVSV